MHYSCAGPKTAGSMLRLSSHEALSSQADSIGDSCAQGEQCASVAEGLQQLQLVTTDSAKNL